MPKKAKFFWGEVKQKAGSVIARTLEGIVGVDLLKYLFGRAFHVIQVKNIDLICSLELVLLSEVKVIEVVEGYPIANIYQYVRYESILNDIFDQYQVLSFAIYFYIDSNADVFVAWIEIQHVELFEIPSVDLVNQQLYSRI